MLVAYVEEREIDYKALIGSHLSEVFYLDLRTIKNVPPETMG